MTVPKRRAAGRALISLEIEPSFRSPRFCCRRRFARRPVAGSYLPPPPRCRPPCAPCSAGQRCCGCRAAPPHSRLTAGVGRLLCSARLGLLLFVLEGPGRHRHHGEAHGGGFCHSHQGQCRAAPVGPERLASLRGTTGPAGRGFVSLGVLLRMAVWQRLLWGGRTTAVLSEGGDADLGVHRSVLSVRCGCFQILLKHTRAVLLRVGRAARCPSHSSAVAAAQPGEREGMWS